MLPNTYASVSPIGEAWGFTSPSSNPVSAPSSVPAAARTSEKESR
jgi:hypothetical protein